jgi:hypothetical protein
VLIGEDMPLPETFDVRWVGRLIWRRDEADAMCVKVEVECELMECVSVIVDIESLRVMFPNAPRFGEVETGSEA